MSDEHDPILDACLDEILGGTTPPDLSPRIMRAWSMLPPQLPLEQPAAPPVQNPVTIQPASRTPAASSSTFLGVNRMGLSLVAAAAVVVIGLGLGVAMRPKAPPAEDPNGIAQGDGNTGTTTTPNQPDQPQSPSAPQQNDLVDSPGTSPSSDDAPEVITPKFETDPPFGSDHQQQPIELAIAPSPRVAPRDDAEMIDAINVAIRAAWQEYQISPAAPASDEDFTRRLYLQVLGRDPTSAEIQSLVTSRSKDKRALLVDELLTREENIEEFARRWSDLWADALVGQEGTTLANQASREGLRQYLRRTIQQAMPFDQTASELLTASGSGQIGSPGYDGAANFLLAHHDRNAARATAHVARAFFGKRIQCAQCHDHPGDSSLAQNRFWELNTFLRQVSVTRGDQDRPAVLASRDFHGDGGGDGSEAEVFYETASGEVKVAYPALPGVTGVPRTGIVKEFDRRAGLARYVAANDDFRRAVVNRVWSGIFGYGFTSPVDDMGPHNPPSHPELLNDLADQFAAHDHDLRSLVRWMVLSESFQLSRGAGVDLADAPELGRPRRFSRHYPPAADEPAAQAALLAMAKAAAKDPTELGIGTTANVKPSFPTPGLKKTDNGTSPLLIAAPTVGQASNFVPANVERILDSSMSGEEKVKHLFLVAVQRQPSGRERALVQEIAGDITKVDRATLLQIWWTLDRSSEFGADR